MLNKIIVAIVVIAFAPIFAFAQTTSRGPGKGPPEGTGKSIYTYPQAPKSKPYSMTSMRLAYQVPENAEKFTWRLTSKIDGRDPDKPTTDVPVYSFAGGKRVQVGLAKAGEEIILNEMRPVGKAHYYNFPWSGASASAKAGPAQDYWISGSNIEYAGAK